jgi:hypothetical protein
MLYIQSYNLSDIQWHVGEPLPANLGPVVSFHADGDELTLILNAMRMATITEMTHIGEFVGE